MKSNKLMANSIDMITLLRQLNEPLKKRGKHIKWITHESVSFKDNMWYQHSMKRGGLPIDFLMTFFNMTYHESTTYLIKNFDLNPDNVPNYSNTTSFSFPAPNSNNIAVITYLESFRFIDRSIIDYFIEKEIIYEDRFYHNCNFIGCNDDGIPVHVHSQSTHISKKEYRGVKEGSDTNYPFNHITSSRELYVFESVIDLMSYITLNKHDIENHSYLSLCGISDKPLSNILRVYDHIESVILCLDNDLAGETAKAHIKEKILENFNIVVEIRNPQFKDFNEDLKAIHDMPVKSGIRNELYENLNTIICKMISSDEKKSKTLKDLLNDFSQFLYTNHSSNIKIREKAYNSLLKSAMTSIIMAKQQVTHLEENYSIEDLIHSLISDDESFMEFVDTSDKYSLFIQDLDFLKVELRSKQYHHKQEKLNIIKTLMSFAKKAIYTHVFLFHQERTYHEQYPKFY